MTADETYAEFAFAAGAMEDQKPATLRGTFAFIHPSSRLGARVVIFPGAYISNAVEIGADCVIGPGASIGAFGFGYTEQTDGSWEYRGHSFGVVLADDVHVGANATIARGRHRPTRIGRGSRLDAGTFVAHNVEIGKNVLVIANAMIAGSCEVGDGAIIGPGAMLRDHVKVGERAFVGMGAVVTKDVPPGEVWAGSPARFMRLRGEELR